MAKLCHARDLDLRVGNRVVVETEDGTFVGRVALTPRRREPYMLPYSIVRVVDPEDERAEDAHRELGRDVRNEAQKLARDHQIKGVEFFGCDVSLDGSYIEVKYGAEGRVVCVLTGHGLKDPQTAMSRAAPVVPCEPDIGSVEQAVLA